jgi:hypothetical protein
MFGIIYQHWTGEVTDSFQTNNLSRRDLPQAVILRCPKICIHYVVKLKERIAHFADNFARSALNFWHNERKEDSVDEIHF